MVLVCCYFYYTLLCCHKIVLIWTMQQYHLNKLSPELGAEISEIDLSKDFNEVLQNKIRINIKDIKGNTLNSIEKSYKK